MINIVKALIPGRCAILNYYCAIIITNNWCSCLQFSGNKVSRCDRVTKCSCYSVKPPYHTVLNMVD